MIPDDPAIRKIRSRHSDIPQDPLFDINDKRSEEPTKKAATPKIVARVKCPVCHQEKIGVIRALDDTFRTHYILREHYRITMSGHRFVCAGSGSEQGFDAD